MFIKVVNSATELYMIRADRLVQINSLSATSMDLIFEDSSAPKTNAVIVITLTFTSGTKEDVLNSIKEKGNKAENEFKFDWELFNATTGYKFCPHVTNATISKKYK